VRRTIFNLTLLWAASVCLSFWLVYGQCIPVFAVDDPSYARITRGLLGHPLVWLSPWNQFGWTFRPVFDEYFYAVYVFGGGRPVPFFVTGLALNGTIAFLAAWFFYRITRSRSKAFLVLGAALLFPQDKWEAITGIASQATLLAALCMLICMHAWLSWRRGQGRAWYMVAVLAFFLALGAKQDAFSLILLIPLLDLMVCDSGTCGHNWRSHARSWLPLLAIFLLGMEFNVISAHTSAFAHVVHAGRTLTRPLERLRDVEFFIGHSCPLIDLSQGTLLLGLSVASYVLLARGNRVVLFFVLAMLASDIPAPYGAGSHALFFGRFLYIPSLFLAMAAVDLGAHLLRLREFGILVILAVGGTAIHAGYPGLLPDAGDLQLDLMIVSILTATGLLTSGFFACARARDPWYCLRLLQSSWRHGAAARARKALMAIPAADLAAGSTLIFLVTLSRVDVAVWTVVLAAAYFGLRAANRSLPFQPVWLAVVIGTTR